MRRTPRQLRAKQTVDAMLEAVVKILKEGGIEKITTNRIADVAGVSIGSVYQYFPDKKAIFEALHDRHVREAIRVAEHAVVENAQGSVEKLFRALLDGLVDLHAEDSEFHELLVSQVPHGAESDRLFHESLSRALTLALSSRKPRKKVFLISHLLESLSHRIAFHRPKEISLAEGKEEAVKAILGYWRSV
jgi:AcrR family transcriptional regulator